MKQNPLLHRLRRGSAHRPLCVGRSLIDDADSTAARSTLGLVIGTDLEAHDQDLTAIAGLAPVNDDIIQRKAGAWINRSIAQLKADFALSFSDLSGSATDAQIPNNLTLTDFSNATHNHINAAGGGQLAEGALTLTDVTTNDVSTSRHGFFPKLPNTGAGRLWSEAGTWVSVTASPGGSNTQVQFNDSGAFGGDAGFTFNKATDVATLGGVTLASGGKYGWAQDANTYITSGFNNGFDVFAGGIRAFRVNQGDSTSIGIPNGWCIRFATTDAALGYDGSICRGGAGIINLNSTYVSPLKTDTFGATMSVNLAQGNVHTITLTNNITSLTISNLAAGGEYTLILVQDATGSRTVSWPASVKWSGGVAPTLSGASKADVLTFVSDGTNLYEKARALNQ